MIAIELARRGANVAVNYNSNRAEAEKVVAEIKALHRTSVAIRADMGSISDIRRMFREAVEFFDCKDRGLNIVVSNAGVNSFSHLKDTEEEEFDRVFAVNTKGQFFVAQEAFRNMASDGSGRIILLSSRTAQGRGFASHAIYAGSKGAVESFVRCMANDCADKKITVNAIAPGATNTDQLKNIRNYVPNSDGKSEEELIRGLAGLHPFNRIGEPEDIARVVAFLASEDGGWINGQVVAVDGDIRL